MELKKHVYANDNWEDGDVFITKDTKIFLDVLCRLECWGTKDFFIAIQKSKNILWIFHPLCPNL